MDDIREIVQAVVQEFMPQKTELEEERKRREALEERVRELVVKADEAERSAAVRAELQRQGVAKLDLAYKAIRDEIQRGEDGKLIGMTGAGGAVREGESGTAAGAAGGRVRRGRGAEKRAG